MYGKYWRIVIIGFLSVLLVALTPFYTLSQPTSTSTPSSPSQTSSPAKMTVRLGDRALFVIGNKGLAPTVKNRVQVIERRVKQFAESSVAVDAIYSSDIEGNTLVAAENELLFGIYDEDAKAVGKTRQVLAKEYTQKLQQAVSQYREERSAQSRLRASLVAVLSTLGLILVLALLNKGAPRLHQWLDEQRNRRIPNIRLQRLELLSSSQLSALLKMLTRLIQVVLTLALIYGYLSFILSLFPVTRKFGKTLLGFIWGALQRFWNAVMAYLPNLVTIVLIVIITYYIIRFSRFFFSAISRGTFTLPGFYREWAQPTHRLLTYLIVALALAITYPFLPGSGSPAFHGISIFLGALVSLGATSAVANIVAGIILVYTRAFQVGDRVEVAGTLGDVEGKTLLVTRIRTLNNVLVTVPNASLLSNNIINYSALIRDSNTPLALHTTVTLGYDAPWRDIYAALTAAARATDYILDNPAPFVLQTSLNDFYVSYQLKAFTNYPQRMQFIYSELHQNIQDKCNEAGIEIMSPHYSSVRDGNQTTVPSDYLSPDYTAPGFRIDPLKSLLNPIAKPTDSSNSSTSE